MAKENKVILRIRKRPSQHLDKQTEKAQSHSDDQVIAFNYLDNLKAWRIGISVNTFRFNARLDSEKLRAALQKLFEKDGWKKLGARVRKTKVGKGDLEYHLPSRFDNDRPAFEWSHADHQSSIHDHELGSRVPAGSSWSSPQFFEDTHTTTNFLYPVDTLPTSFKSWIAGDRGCLAFQVHTFDDATLISISFSHAWMDGMAFSNILHAWSMVLAGREAEVPPYIDTDAVSEYLQSVKHSDITPEKHCLYDIRVRGPKKVLTMGNVGMGFLKHPWVEGEERTVCLPASYVEALKVRAMREIDGQRLSENDVLFAWRSRLIASLLKLKPSTPIGLLQPYSIRGLFDNLPLDKAYTSNSTGFSYTALTAKQLLTDSLGSVALRIQQDLRVQRTKEQAEAYLKLVQRDGLTTFGAWNQVVMAWSNWSRADLYNLDFTAALPEGEQDMAGGKPCYINTHAHINGPLKFRNAGCLLGHDAYGNRWLYWSMRSELWAEAKEKIMANAI